MSKQFYLMLKQVNPMLKQLYPMSKQVNHLSKQVYPMSKQLYPMSKQLYPMSKQVNPMLKQLYPMSKQVNHMSKQLYSMSKQLYSMSKLKWYIFKNFLWTTIYFLIYAFKGGCAEAGGNLFKQFLADLVLNGFHHLHLYAVQPNSMGTCSLYSVHCTIIKIYSPP